MALKKQEKGKEGVSSSAPKVVEKEAPKRRADGKDYRPSKEVTVTPGEKHPKKLSPLKPSHGVGKGLITSLSPVTEGAHRLLMHKGYTVEMVESIIKQTDVEPCAEQETEDLGASDFFDLSKVFPSFKLSFIVLFTK